MLAADRRAAILRTLQAGGSARVADLAAQLDVSEMTVRRDLEAFMTRLVPDGDRLFEHTDEGTDDMPAHVRTVCLEFFGNARDAVPSTTLPMNRSSPGWCGCPSATSKLSRG